MSDDPILTATPVFEKDSFTVREHLTFVKQLILDEPARLDMRDWILRLCGLPRNSDQFKPYHTDNKEMVPRPKCGTVGCLAGWMIITLRELLGNPSPDSLYMYADDFCASMLGIKGEEQYECPDIFAARPLPTDNRELMTLLGSYRAILPPAGSPELAQLIINRIDYYLTHNPELADRVWTRQELRSKFTAYIEGR